MARLALILLMLTVPAVSATAQTAQSAGGNPLMGRQTAATLCVPCHQIGETRRDGAPSFVDIANMPSTTALSLKVFLRSSHREMPNLIIPDSQTDDLIAYILNLRQPSAPRRR
jgi:mono/diheme cytochrome c family protein